MVIYLIKGPVRSVKTFPLDPLATEQNQHPWRNTQMGFKNLPLKHLDFSTLCWPWACHSSSAASSTSLSLFHSLCDTELSCVPKLSKLSPIFTVGSDFCKIRFCLAPCMTGDGTNMTFFLWAFFLLSPTPQRYICYIYIISPLLLIAT